MDLLGLSISGEVFFDIMVSFAFFIGIIMIVSPEAFMNLNRDLQKEYGVRRRLIPWIEDYRIDAVDRFILTHRIPAGVIIASFSFILLLTRG